MHRRLWLLVGAAVAVGIIATTATATSKVAGSARASDATPAAAPFAESWAQVPRTTAGRKAKNVVVVGEEQDVNGFNTILNCCNQLAGSYIGNFEASHGAFNLNEKGVYFKDLVSAASATKTTLSYTIRPDANWYWGGKKLPLTYKDFVYTWQQCIDRRTTSSTRARRTTRSRATPTRARSRSRSSGRLAPRRQRLEAVWSVRQLAVDLRRYLPRQRAGRDGLQQDLNRLHLW